MIQQVEVGQDGVTMLDLYRAAQRIGLNVAAKQLDLKELVAHDGPAIVFVNGNHFFVVETIEGGWVRIIDHDLNFPRLVSEQDFQKMWNGESLLVARPSSPERAPRIRFSSTIHDFGRAPLGSTVSHDFRFRNEGAVALQVKSFTIPCACAVVGPHRKWIPPGESGTVQVSLTLESGFGPHGHRSLNVYTNDPASPVTILTLVGEETARLDVTPPQVYFGRIRRDETVKRRITVRSMDDVLLGVIDVQLSSDSLHLQVELDQKDNERVNLTEYFRSIRSARAGSSSEEDALARLPPGRSVKMVTLDLTIGPNLPDGSFSESITITLASSQEWSSESVSVTIPVEGEVTGDVALDPKRFFFGVVSPGTVAFCTLRLLNHGERAVRIQKVESRHPSLEVHAIPGADRREYLIEATLKVKENISHGRFVSSVVLYTDHPDYPRIEIPVYAFVKSDDQ